MSQIIIGITGGIGSGKTTISEFLNTLGYPIYSSDIQAKWLMENDAVVGRELVNLFGDAAFSDGKLDRKHLSSLVFSDKDNLDKLNAIVHPALERDFDKWCEGQSAELVFKEAAILFESGSYKNVDKTICVTAPEALRIKRVMQRDGVSEDKVKERIDNQWSEEKKKALADFVIFADDEQLIIPQILKIIENINSVKS
jgi:dephospho-CoA kinase